MLLLMPGFSLAGGPPELTPRLLSTRYASLHGHLAVRQGLGYRLEPRPFSGPRASTGKLLRFSWKIAASELTSRLFKARDALQCLHLTDNPGP
jgi:hypothetical protein